MSREVGGVGWVGGGWRLVTIMLDRSLTTLLVLYSTVGGAGRGAL
jgi:hypothetical protein